MKTLTQPKILIAIPFLLGLLVTLAYAARPAEIPLEQAVEQAKTPDDHEKIAARYERKAERLLKSARHYERLAKIYAKTDNPKVAADSARHFRAIAQKLKETAAEMQAMAKMHRELGASQRR